MIYEESITMSVSKEAYLLEQAVRAGVDGKSRFQVAEAISICEQMLIEISALKEKMEIRARNLKAQQK